MTEMRMREEILGPDCPEWYTAPNDEKWESAKTHSMRRFHYGEVLVLESRIFLDAVWRSVENPR